MRIGFFGDSLTSGVPGSSYVALLRERFPNYTLLSFGKPNDTVVSLHRRISTMRFEEPLDIAFLWIGVNDVSQTARWPYRAFHTLLAQRRARDMDEFRACFRDMLQRLCDLSDRVFVAPPALRGEDLDSPWNRRLANLAGLIEGLTAEFDRAQFLDLQAVFARELLTRSGAEYVSRNPFRVMLDALTLRADGQIDAKSTKRGLFLTLDGIHLNSAGAKLVAEEFAAVIRDHRQGR